MAEMVTKCKYHNVGYCKYKDNCKFSHPSAECGKKCQLKNCMKRHIKLCRYGMKCRLKDKCAFKHTKTKEAKVGNNDSADKIAALENAVKELLDYKIESEKKIENLENQLDVMKVKLAKEFVSLEKVLERKQGNIISIQTDVKGLKNEFALLKHTNQDKPDLKGDVQQPVQQKEFKCDQCNVAFKTENGVKVHKEIAHINS